MTRHELTTTVTIADTELPIRITYTYDPGDPGCMYQRNGDPGWPSEPPSADIVDIKVRLDDGWMTASDRVWGVVEGDVDIYEQMLDAAQDDLVGWREAAEEARMEDRHA